MNTLASSKLVYKRKDRQKVQNGYPILLSCSINWGKMRILKKKLLLNVKTGKRKRTIGEMHGTERTAYT